MAAQATTGPTNGYGPASPGPIQGTSIACTSLTTSGLGTLTGGAVVGTYATAIPALNPYLELKHASTDHPQSSYLICRTSLGVSIGGIDQLTATSIKFTAGAVTASAGLIVGTTADSSPATNAAVNIYHASTDNALASYLVCRNSLGAAIGGFDQETSTTIRVTAGVVSAGIITASGLISANNGLTSTGTVTGATIVSNGTISATSLITASAGVNITGALLADSASIVSGLNCRAPVAGLQTSPAPGVIWADALQIGVSPAAITLTGGKITGGTSTNASGGYATVVGGVSCVATGTAATVGGGQSNQATANHSTVCGGNSSTATGVGSTSAGTSCSAGGASAVSMGNNNAASGAFSTCAGGSGNEAAAFYSATCGGNANKVWPGSDNSIIMGGNANSILSGNNSVVIGGNGISGAQGNTAFAQRLNTKGGRQKRVDTYTTSVQLGLDHHVVLLSSVTATALVATLPSSPVDGQEYIIKCIASIASTPTTSSITVTSGAVKPIIPAGGGGNYFTSANMIKGAVLHLVYSDVNNSWMEAALSSVGSITTAGAFKVGTATGAINLACEVFHSSGSNNLASFYICRSSTGADIGGFSQASATTVDCNAANVTAPSDYRLKHDITDLEGSLSRVCALRPRSYIWNCSHRCTRGGDGFIAHELAEVIPACVFGEKDAVDADGEPVYQRVDVQKIIVHLVGAIQELSQRLATLEAR